LTVTASTRDLLSSGSDPDTDPLVLNTHRVSDLALGVPGSEPVLPNLLYDNTPREPGPEGIGYITVFDGKWWIQDWDPPNNFYTLEADIEDNISAISTNVRVIWDTNVASQYIDNGLWLPPFEDSIPLNGFNGLVPAANPLVNLGIIVNSGGDPAQFTVDTTDPEFVNEVEIEFFIQFNAITPEFYSARLERPTASDWYRSVRPWAFGIHRAKGNQKGNVTLYNNVIKPTAGEQAKLYYILKRSGPVTIQVFTLAGDIVRVLYRGSLGAGQHSTAWDGRNTGGRVVAKGLYFIRIVAPGIDETRKVLVVK
jgi:fibronectin-binding autotransporter adhesin